MNKYQAICSFWTHFDLPAYDETSVPDGAQLPYITYESSTADFDRPISQSASVWYRSSSWEAVSLKAEEIANYITRGGRLVRYDGGAFWIKRGTPFAQRLGDESDEMVRRIILTVEVEFIENN